MRRLETDWEIGEPLGRGAGGEVFAVRHRVWGHRAAAKRITGSDRVFAAEVQAVARLDSPHVVRIYDAGDGPPPWMVMERARGPVRQVERWDRLRDVLRATLEALAVAHAAGILHLDVKPSNLLVREDRSIALADFGLASLGASRVRGGTPGYLAPERFSGEVGVGADLYAVGCVAWALAAGSPPQDPSSWDDALASTREPLPELVPVIPVPGGFHEWVCALLAPLPDRPTRASDVLWALEQPGEPIAGDGAAESIADAATVGTAAWTVGTAAWTIASRGGPVAGGAGPGSGRAPIPDRWPRAERARRPEALGRGLLGLASVPFAGREREMERLWRALRSPGAPVVLRGPRGVGRTRLGEELAHAAAAWAGFQVFRSVDVAAGAQGRRLVWLDDVTRAPALGGLDDPETLVVAAVREEDVDEALEAWLSGCEVVALEPLPVPIVRRLLADWCGLSANLVGRLAARCAGDLSLALSMVRSGVDSGALVPTDDGLAVSSPEALVVPSESAQVPLTPEVLLAAAWGRDIPRDRAADLSAGAEALVGHGAVARTASGWRWASEPVRQGLLERAGASASASAHGRAAGLCTDEERWERGRHHLAAGAYAEAMEDLFQSSSRRIASGGMAEALQVLEDLEARLPRIDALTEARLCRIRATVGPTYLGFEEVRELNVRAVELARAHDPSHGVWREILLRALSGQAWLAEVRFDVRGAWAVLDELVALEGWTPWHQQVACQLYLVQDEGERAAELGALAHAGARVVGARQTLAVSGVEWARARALRDGPERMPELEEAVRVAIEDFGFEAARADCHRSLGDLYRWFGDLETAAARYEVAQRAIAEGEARADLTTAMSLALLARDRGDAEEAARLLRICRARLRDEGPGWEGALALHLATVAPAEREALLAEALPKLEQTGFRDRDIVRSLALLG